MFLMRLIRALWLSTICEWSLLLSSEGVPGRTSTCPKTRLRTCQLIIKLVKFAFDLLTFIKDGHRECITARRGCISTGVMLASNGISPYGGEIDSCSCSVRNECVNLLSSVSPDCAPYHAAIT